MPLKAIDISTISGAVKLRFRRRAATMSFKATDIFTILNVIKLYLRRPANTTKRLSYPWTSSCEVSRILTFLTSAELVSCSMIGKANGKEESIRSGRPLSGGMGSLDALSAMNGLCTS